LPTHATGSVEGDPSYDTPGLAWSLCGRSHLVGGIEKCAYLGLKGYETPRRARTPASASYLEAELTARPLCVGRWEYQVCEYSRRRCTSVGEGPNAMSHSLLGESSLTNPTNNRRLHTNKPTHARTHAHPLHARTHLVPLLRPEHETSTLTRPTMEYGRSQ
jgi:hypothetical protein